MEKTWINSYTAGVPVEINADAYQSLIEIFDESCRQYRDRPAFYNMGVTLTYHEIDQASRSLAAYFQQVLKLEKGDRIAIMLPNILQYPVVLFAALRLGLIVVNVNPLYTSDELTHQLKDSGAKCIVALENFASTVEKAKSRVTLLEHVVITRLGDLLGVFKGIITHLALKYYYKKMPEWHIPGSISFKAALAAGEGMKLEPVHIENQDTAFLQYTGGTTGVAKGAILTHRNIIANIQQACAWFQHLNDNTKDIVLLTALPLYHIFSLTANCLYFSKIGGLNVLITNPRDIPGTIKEMKKFKFTVITGVNTLFNALLNNPRFASLDFSELRLTLGGGMAVQQAVAEKWHKVTGKPILEAYGLTETSPCVSINPENLPAYNGSIGLPVSSTDVAVFDEDGNRLPYGEAGELAVKGPQVMKGYWQNPEETAKVFTKDGWLLTGDIATLDDKGFIRLLERKKDMILVSGFNVYPSEVEDVLVQHPDVLEAAVVGVEDENSGEAVKAYVVSTNPELDPQVLRKFARQHLTPYKVPKRIEFAKELPKTNVGKILRRALRDDSAAKP